MDYDIYIQFFFGRANSAIFICYDILAAVHMGVSAIGLDVLFSTYTGDNSLGD